jgi:hypothetical protein
MGCLVEASIFFFFFLTFPHKKGGEGFELVIFALLYVVQSIEHL